MSEPGSMPLFPDVLDRMERRGSDRFGIWCADLVPRAKSPLHETRDIRITWEHERTYVDRLPCWKVSIVHHYYAHQNEGTRKYRCVYHSRCVARRFGERHDAVEFLLRVMRRAKRAYDAAACWSTPWGSEELIEDAKPC